MAIDNDREALSIHVKNLDSPVAQVDLAQKSNWSGALERCRPDVLVCGPPCQGLSTVGLFDPLDERNALLGVAAQVAKALKRPIVVIETVPGAASSHQRRNLDSLLKDLSNAGYETQCWKLSASDFGVPQHRRRLVVVGSRGHMPNAPVPVSPGEGVGAFLSDRATACATGRGPQGWHRGAWGRRPTARVRDFLT